MKQMTYLFIILEIVINMNIPSKSSIVKDFNEMHNISDGRISAFQKQHT